jgi:predicted transcriptional regulator
MPSRIKMLNDRLLICHAVMKIVQQASFAYMDSALFGSHASDVMLLFAVFIGQAERRPMTATKLADFVGIPRATIVRRLRVLQAAGMVHLEKNGAATCDVERLNSARVVEATEQAILAIHKAAAGLSKMDSDKLAPL